jgi:hypothetical protein
MSYKYKIHQINYFKNSILINNKFIDKLNIIHFKLIYKISPTAIT